VSNVFFVLACVIVYVVLSDRVGFLILSFAILSFLFWRFGEPPLRSAVISILATLFIQVSFVDVLRVPLPRGLLDRILW
jgi:putative tricarboxylic transport membrane protein